MRRIHRDVTSGNIALSFIDVLASALGAAVLLFVILASTPTSVTSRSKAQGGFLRYEWSVQADEKALLRILVRGPYDDPSGEPKYLSLGDLEGETVVDCPATIKGIASYALIGFAPDSTPGDQPTRTYILRLNKPAKGDWQVGIMYYRYKETITSKLAPVMVTGSPPAKDKMAQEQLGTRKMISAIGEPLSVDDSPHIQLPYGAQLLSPVVTEGGSDPTGC